MNQTQRKFLIERIQSKTKEKISELEKTRLEYPSASNYIFKAIMNDSLELQPESVILAAIKDRAMNAKEGSNWLSGDRMGYDKERTIRMDLKSLIITPKDFDIEIKRVRDFNDNIRKQIDELKLQLESVEVRVQLASDKTLQNLINEVDDMGDLSLMNTELKKLN